MGIKYIHIPVEFGSPKIEEYQEFVSVLNKNKKSKVLVHCAANKRVSAFIAIYRILSLGWKKEKAIRELERIWKPNKIWESFIEEQLTRCSY